jgi:hypothetical protein
MEGNLKIKTKTKNKLEGFNNYKHIKNCPFLVEHGYDRFWLEKYKFNISKLHLKKEKAEEWATRAVKVCLEMMKEDLDQAIELCNHVS